MSDTKKSNAAIACGDMKLKDDGKGIIIDQGNYGPSKNEINQLAGMEIKFDEECIVMNETPNGTIAMIDKNTGLIGYLEGDGTLKRKLEEKDKKDKKAKRIEER